MPQAGCAFFCVSGWICMPSKPRMSGYPLVNVKKNLDIVTQIFSAAARISARRDEECVTKTQESARDDPCQSRITACGGRGYFRSDTGKPAASCAVATIDLGRLWKSAVRNTHFTTADSINLLRRCRSVGPGARFLLKKKLAYAARASASASSGVNQPRIRRG